GDSGLIDMTPNTDAINSCAYKGQNTPATPDPSKYVDKNGNGVADPGEFYHDGQPVCGKGGSSPTGPTSADFNNNVVFDPVRLNRHRLGGGFNLKFQVVQFGIHFISDVVDVKDANKDQVCSTPDCSGSNEPAWGAHWRDAAKKSGATTVSAFPD